MGLSAALLLSGCGQNKKGNNYSSDSNESSLPSSSSSQGEPQWYDNFVDDGYTVAETFVDVIEEMRSFLGFTKVSFPEYEPETGCVYSSFKKTSSSIARFEIVVEDDQEAAIVTLFDGADYWFDTSAYSDYGYIVKAKDLTYEVDIISYATSEDDDAPIVTSLTFYKISDLYDTAKTINTEWAAAEQELMVTKTGEALPFFQMGASYGIVDYAEYMVEAYQEQYDDLTDDEIVSIREQYKDTYILFDYYIEDLSSEYGLFLTSNGFDYVEAEDLYIKTLEDGKVLSVSFYYSSGHQITVRRSSALTGIAFASYDYETGDYAEITELNVEVGGYADFSLIAIPSDALILDEVVYSSSDETIAFVESEEFWGMEFWFISAGTAATVGATATITATAGDFSASVEVTIVEATEGED